MNRSQARSGDDLPESFFDDGTQHDPRAFYELSPEFAAEKGARYLAVAYDGSIEFVDDLPAGADIIGHTEASHDYCWE